MGKDGEGGLSWKRCAQRLRGEVVTTIRTNIAFNYFGQISGHIVLQIALAAENGA